MNEKIINYKFIPNENIFLIYNRNLNPLNFIQDYKIFKPIIFIFNSFIIL